MNAPKALIRSAAMATRRLAVLCWTLPGVCGAQWFPLDGPPGAGFQWFLAKEDTLLAGVREFRVVRSLDDGDTWTDADSAFPDSLIGPPLFVGSHMLVGSSRGVLLSRDGGVSWDNTTASLGHLQVDGLALAGSWVLAASDGGILRSSDDGITWIRADVGPPLPVLRDLCANDNVALVLASYGSIFRSTDAGATWVLVREGNADILSLFGDIGLAAEGGWTEDEPGAIVRSSDAGLTWVRLSDGPMNDVTSFAWTDSVLFAGSIPSLWAGSGIYCSKDQGLTWASIPSPAEYVYGLGVTDSSLIAIVPECACRSADLGRTWTRMCDDLAYSTPWVAAMGGMVFASGGYRVYRGSVASWELLLTGQGLYAPVDAMDGRVFILGDGLTVSSDSGNTWSSTEGLESTRSIVSIGDTIFVGHQVTVSGPSWFPYGGGVSRSRNGGRDWSYLGGELEDRAVADLAYAEGRYYALAGPSGERVFWTTSEGTEWYPFSEGLELQNPVELERLDTMLFCASWDGGIMRRGLHETSWVASDSGLPGGYVYSLHAFDGTIGVATDRAVCLWDRDAKMWTDITANLVPSLYYELSSSEDHLLVGTGGNGVWGRPLADILEFLVPSLKFPPHGSRVPAYGLAVEWLALGGTSSYRVQVAVDSLFQTSGIVVDTSVQGTRLEIPNLSNEGEYFWRVRGIQGGTSSKWSSTRKFATVPVPGEIRLVAPADEMVVTADSVVLVWSVGIPAAQRYWLEVASDSGFGSVSLDSVLADSFAVFRDFDVYTSFWWRVRGGNDWGWGPFSEVGRFSVQVTGVAIETGQPSSFSLEQNYPNPFNPSTTIRYGLPGRSHVILTVCNTLGQQVATLVERDMEAGYHEVKFDASDLASGVYLYRLVAGDLVLVRKLTVLK